MIWAAGGLDWLQMPTIDDPAWGARARRGVRCGGHRNARSGARVDRSVT